MDFRRGQRQGSQYQPRYFWLDTDIGLRVANERRYDFKDIPFSTYGVGNSITVRPNTFFAVNVRAFDACSNFLFAILDMTLPSVHAQVPQSGTLRVRVGLDWLEGRRWHSLNPGMSACMILQLVNGSVVANVVQLPICFWYRCTGWTRCKVTLLDQAVIGAARPCSQAG
eukprot:1156488-Pelagomonas_calceolata.AAC.1